MISRPIINVSYAILKILFSHQLRFQSVNVWAVMLWIPQLVHVVVVAVANS